MSQNDYAILATFSEALLLLSYIRFKYLSLAVMFFQAKDFRVLCLNAADYSTAKNTFPALKINC